MRFVTILYEKIQRFFSGGKGGAEWLEYMGDVLIWVYNVFQIGNEPNCYSDESDMYMASLVIGAMLD